MNPDLDRLQPYPFARMERLLAGVTPPAGCAPIALSIGEPRHRPPAAVGQALAEHSNSLGQYPPTRGGPALREAIADWLTRRFSLRPIDAEREVLPVNGTREALFAIAQAAVDRSRPRPAVLLPNPCYQIYEGAALLAGAEPVYYPAADDDEPDFDAIDEADWARCQLFYLCNPGNPTGALIRPETQRGLIERARHHGFVIAADECYSEIHADADNPPSGLLEAAGADFDRCLVFHSLSKRSNVPGLRSGFVAGDARLIADFTRYRTYHGCAMAPPTQAASVAAWRDEVHVRDNRALYRRKFDSFLARLDNALAVTRPAGGFYLWPRVPGGDDEAFSRDLYAATGVQVLPGSYLGRPVGGHNPAAGRVRMALVAEPEACDEAATRIREFVRQGATA